jgi:hypothetical protein
MSLDYFNSREHHARPRRLLIIWKVLAKDFPLIVTAIAMIILFLVIYFALPGPSGAGVEAAHP